MDIIVSSPHPCDKGNGEVSSTVNNIFSFFLASQVILDVWLYTYILMPHTVLELVSCTLFRLSFAFLVVPVAVLT